MKVQTRSSPNAESPALSLLSSIPHQMHAEANNLSIGALKLESPVLLAPMAGYTDLPFRTIVRDFGGLGAAVTEMLNPRSFLTGTNTKIKHLLATSPKDRPLIHQIYGHEADTMAAGAHWLEQNGAQAIDINMGCPQRKITRRGAGAGLLRDPEAAVALAAAVIGSVNVPVTAKIRTGWTAEHPVAVDLAVGLKEAGVQALGVHARTRDQGFAGKADWDVIARVASAVSELPVIGNGDIASADDAVAMLAHTHCSGIMVGRQALKQPWLLRDIADRLRGQDQEASPDPRAHAAIMRRHLDLMGSEYGDDLAARLFRRWTPQYSKAMGIGRGEMIRILAIDNMGQLRVAIKELGER